MILDTRIKRNKNFLADLFAGPFRGHGIVMEPQYPDAPGPGDFTCSDRPHDEWVSWIINRYHTKCESLEALDDDSVPDISLHTGTHVFAATFGCPVHVDPNSPACALPRVTEAREADLLPEPDINTPPLDRVFEMGQTLRRHLGPDAPMNVPDIQSPFDIAALVWKKEELLVAMYENPQSVKRLVDKCCKLLTSFLLEFKKRFPECNLVHCPNAWAPPELGCSLSEDEAGTISTAMFEEFCLPSLTELSNTFGGLFMHCCADADHQYGQFNKIPNLRGLNRVYQAAGPKPAIEAFSGRTVLMQAWYDEEAVNNMIDMALPDTRFLFNMAAESLEDAKRMYERLRKRCPRR